MCQSGEQPDIIRSAAAIRFVAAEPHSEELLVSEGAESRQQCISSSGLGTSAISSLLARCKQQFCAEILCRNSSTIIICQVMLSFARDELNAGQLRLPQERILEMSSVLHAVSTLIEGLVRHVDNFNPEIYRELVNLYPSVVDCVPSTRADLQVEQSLINALKSYQALLLLNMRKFE
ncbi:unnamed protein product [Gongylonema pulchrum]|uniref:Mon2_C domain-containing protein n=1 Tax=Gongylonema pulchrum TaxID=637853 RepID=A0A183D985_9BILA|nr:unnamed protein product [Gongylonema pulchrum]